ncbi:hypothetical protein LSCM1_06416 [Leishmania martiniquensis]|uniref:Uncharacterized protein n=1 Tax=Leishmania martiniquensis TaxID=1580590 RepID=A0A836GDI5_9TRYP|nr:hypothetical protein LSCM1_06416 [Leishmania martiniquensis]
MGAVPSRECTSLFSYFRGSYEVGMVPLTKHYFGRDAEAAAAVDVDGCIRAGSPECTATAGRKPHQLPFSLQHAGSRSHMRQQLRQQLLLMRRDPAVRYANARDADNILQSLSHQEKSRTRHRDDRNGEAHANPADAGSLPSAASVAKAVSTSAAAGASASEWQVPSFLEQRQGVSGKALSCETEHLLDNYWRIMPESNFTEEDLDRFLDLVDATLFDTNEELLSAEPFILGTGAVSGTSSTKPFMPVPCALCLAYPDGKEREGALTLEGRVINIIGYFGLMTREMQDAFKIVKRLPGEAETPLQQQQQHARGAGSSSAPPLFLNTAILTSAGDRTLERVLVLAAVMLRQQFHTIGRRHVLQAKLDHLLRGQREQRSVDPQLMRYLQALLALPPRADRQQPYFDPLLEIPLPSIPPGIYTPTQYVNAASNEVSLRPHASSLGSCSRLAVNSFSDDGKLQSAAMGLYAGAAGGSSPSTVRSLPSDRPPTMGGALSASDAGSGHVLLYPQQNAGGVSGVAFSVPGAGSGPEGTCPLLVDGCYRAVGVNVPIPSPFLAGSLPLSQSEEDAITLALCRRMEQARVVIETASNNYSALKSLTENFAFLCCQILLDQSLIKMELIELPALVATPSFKPAEFATTVATTVGTTPADEGRAAAVVPQPMADDEKKPSGAEQPPQPRLSPSSAVLIKLDPLHVSQATMWASSFFHCPMLLPSGGWVKYKLKDECEQLRHVLQNKDMLIAHWRKTDADRAGQYLGKHTARLLEHVRALQAETEEARALSAEYWMQRPLYVNQDGRKYALYQSRYGTMLIGVRAFAASNASPTAAANVKEERSGSAKAAAGSNATSLSGGSTSLATPAGRCSTLAASLPTATGVSGNGLAIAPRTAAPRSSTESGNRTSHAGVLSSNDEDGVGPKTLSSNTNDRHGRGVGGCMGGGNAGYFSSGLYTSYQTHPANGSNGAGAYVPAPFMQPHICFRNSSGGFDSPPYMMGGSNSRPGEGAPYFASSSAYGHPMEMRAGYNVPPPQQHTCTNISTAPSVHTSKSARSSAHTHVGGNPALGATGWVALQPNTAQISPPYAPSHMKGAPKDQQQSEAMASPSGCAYAAALLPMSYQHAPPNHYATSQIVHPATACVCGSASSPQLPLIVGEEVSSSPRRMEVAATPQPPLESTGGCCAQHALATGASVNTSVSRPSMDVKASWANDKSVEAARLWEPAEAAKSATSSTQHGNSTSTTPTAAAPFPHGCVGMNRDHVGSAGEHVSGSQRDVSAPPQVIRGNSDIYLKAPDQRGAADKAAVLQSVMPWSLQSAAGWTSNDDATDSTTQFLLRSSELLDTDDDEIKKAPAGDTRCPAASLGATDEGEAMRLSHVARRTSGRDVCVGSTAKPLLHSPRAKNMSIMSMLLAAEQPQHVSFPALAEQPQPAQAPPFPPGGAFPVYVLQLPPHASPQQQQSQLQPPLPTTSQSPATAVPPDKPLYYAMANGVPLLVQPATTTSGMAMAYSNGQTHPQGGNGAVPYPTVPQQPVPLMRPGQAMISMTGVDKRQVAQGTAQLGTLWDGQYRVFPNGVDILAGSFVSGRTPANKNGSFDNLFHPNTSFS